MGKEKFVPRLCGGTFFTLMLKARIDTRKSQIHLFKALMKLYDPSVDGVYIDSFKTPASQFRNCNQKYSCDYIKFGDTTTKRAFEDRFKTDYEGLLKETEKLCNDYLTKGRFSKSEIFIKDVLALIYQDDSIQENEKLYIEFGGSAIEKKDLMQVENLYFPSVVIGLWHYICTKRIDNSVGIKTIEKWNENPFSGNVEMFAKIRLMFNRPEYVDVDEEVEVLKMSEIAAVGFPTENATQRFEKIVKRNVRKVKSPYTVYIERAKESFKTSKSFFYPNEEKTFYDFYVCNNLTKRRNLYWGNAELTNCSFEELAASSYKDITVKKLTSLTKNAVITGTGGLGKSMMMRHLMLNALETYTEDKLFPAFVVLKDYDHKKQNLLEYIFSQIEHLNSDLVIDDLIELMKDGNVIFLLDGLDEIKARCRNKFNDELNKLSEKYPECSYVLSSRPIGTFGEFRHFRVYDLEPLTKEQAIKVIEKLDFRVYNPAIKNDFIKELDERLYKEKKEFASNPLLLTIMLITFEQFHKIPTQKFLFYEQAYEALTQKHDAHKALTREYATGLEPYEFKQYFSEFCAVTYQEELYKFSKEQLEQYFQQIIEYNDLDTSPSAFITDATEKICLLYLDGDAYSFCHRSFQEYFAAYFCSRQIEDRFGAIREMFNEKDDSAFDDETLEMLFGMDEQKTEKQIIIPFLESLFETGDDHTDYVAFLKKFYPYITFEKGVFSEDSNEEETSWQYSFIANNYKFKNEINGDEIECGYDRATIIYVYMNCNWENPGMEPKMELVSLDDLPKGYKNRNVDGEYEDEENIEFVGMAVTIDVEYIYGEHEYARYYEKERKIVENKDFPYYLEFVAAKKLLVKLKEKYRKKKNSNWLEMFH